MQYGDFPVTAAAASDARERADFIRKTYVHLALAVGAFMGVEALLLGSPFAEVLVRGALGTRWGWLIMLGAFMLVGHVAQRWAASGASQSVQYAGLALYVVAEAIIMLPLLYMAAYVAGRPQIIMEAAIYTGLVFTGLTATVFMMRADFSFMRGMLTAGGFVAMGVVLVSILFGFNLGTFFAAAMVLLAAGYILYETSNVLHHYPPGSHVAASLTLFASVALLLWYILRILMSLNRR